jgi:hypothetical protein
MNGGKPVCVDDPLHGACGRDGLVEMLDSDWHLLMRRISSGACTPFLGAGACYGTLPVGSDLAKRWAGEHGYPLDDSFDLARVAQYIGVH